MARRCELTGKWTAFGHSRSHSMHATKRKFKVNIVKKYIDFGDWHKVKVKLAANVYKSLVKKGVI